jgi:hypothetical protein
MSETDDDEVIRMWTDSSQGSWVAEWLGGEYDAGTVGAPGPRGEDWGLLEVPTRGGTLTVAPYDTITVAGEGRVYLTAPVFVEDYFGSAAFKDFDQLPNLDMSDVDPAALLGVIEKEIARRQTWFITLNTRP